MYKWFWTIFSLGAPELSNLIHKLDQLDSLIFWFLLASLSSSCLFLNTFEYANFRFYDSWYLTEVFILFLLSLGSSSLGCLFYLFPLYRYFLCYVTCIFLLSEWCQKITNRILSVFWRENLPVHLGLRHFFLSSYIFSIWKPNFEQKYFKYGKKKL